MGDEERGGGEGGKKNGRLVDKKGGIKKKYKLKKIFF